MVVAVAASVAVVAAADVGTLHPETIDEAGPS